jgi:hypothetical protein
MLHLISHGAVLVAQTFWASPICNLGCRQAKRTAGQLILLAVNDMLLEHILFVRLKPGR